MPRGHDGYDELFRAEYGAIVRAAFLVNGDAKVAAEVAQEAFAETAEMLGCAPSTASVHLHRARNRLADGLGEEVTVDAV